MKLLKIVQKKLFSLDLPIQIRLMNFIMLGVLIALSPTALITYLNDHKVNGLWAYGLILVSLIIGLYVLNTTKNAQIMGIVISIVVNCIAMPIIFLKTGGAYSGMAIWIVLGILFTWLIVKGIACFVVIILDFLAFVFVLYIEYTHPEMVTPMSSEFAVFNDIVQSVFFVTTVVGTIFKYQSRVYEKQNNELIKREEKLLKIMKELEDANNAKRNFLANMSHEIRTPINGILGMNEMTLLESKDEETLLRASNIDSSCKALLSLINDILDFSKIESGKLEIIPDKYKLFDLINDSVTVVATRAKNKNLKLIVNNNKDLPSELYGDEGRVRQCIVNLLTNAIKYTEKGSVKLSFDYESLSDDEILLKVSVVDTGQGISPENLVELFGEFNRINEKKNRSIEGTGLGLSITKSLIEQMKGKINVESELDKGSNFYFSVPQKILSDEKIGDYNELKNSEKVTKVVETLTYTAPSVRVLCVDDVFMNREVIKIMLERTEMKVDTAESGEEALDLLDKNVYDILFFDHMMPGMDGVELLHELKKHSENPNSKIPTIVLTANAIEGAKEEYIQEGFDSYLSKPVDISTLDNIIIKYLPKEKILM